MAQPITSSKLGSLFHGFDDALLGELLSACQTVSLPAGQQVFRQGEMGSAAYFVQRSLGRTEPKPYFRQSSQRRKVLRLSDRQKLLIPDGKKRVQVVVRLFPGRRWQNCATGGGGEDV